jgi:enolase
MKIESIDAFQIYDSRGNPTLEVSVTLSDGSTGRGLVPSGASTGQFEALELRDANPKRLRGKSVFKAIEHVRGEIAAALRGMNAAEQAEVDRRMIDLDGTPNKSRLGANSILGVSMAVANAAAQAHGQPLHQWLGAGRGYLLPLPEIQIIGGGAHAEWRTDIQDFLVIANGASTYEEALEMTFAVYHAAGDIMRARGKRFGLADEGGYWPEFSRNDEAFEIIIEAIVRAGYTPGRDLSLSLDIAASDLYDAEAGVYRLALENRVFTPDEWTSMLADWCRRYHVLSIEDPAADTDWESWLQFRRKVGSGIQIIGDDLFTTNVDRIREGIARGVANSALIKLNQIGTVTETLEAIRLTQAAGWLPVVSARSGETEDAFISHLAVATNAGQLKVGSFARSERMAKWNEVLRIARDLGPRAEFHGHWILERLSALSSKAAD